MKQQLDVNWNRKKEHFFLFKQFEPFFCATVTIDCKAYATAKEIQTSFFLLLHKTLEAVNHIECFKYHAAEDNVYVYDQINASATIGRADGTFGFP
jgi:chloramphenicol O-acetyltransferase type A